MNIIVDAHVPFIDHRLDDFAHVTRLESRDITPQAVREADALIVRTRTRCDANLLHGSRVRFIGTATIGTDHIDLDYCRRTGITVANAPGCNAPAVAQWVLAAIDAWMSHYHLVEASQLTLGIVGVGHVGSLVAQWAERLGFNLLLNDPPRATQFNDPLADRLVPIDQLWQQAHIITLHVPLTLPGKPWPTWHFCDNHFISHLQRCRLLINAARGELLTDLGQLMACPIDLAIDCWPDEPHPQTDLVQQAFIATPHIAGYSLQGKQRATATVLQALSSWSHLPIALPSTPPITIPPTISLQSIRNSYPILDDSRALKAQPQLFEKLRSTYALRQELS